PSPLGGEVHRSASVRSQEHREQGHLQARQHHKRVPVRLDGMAGWIRQRGDPHARDSAAPPCLGLLRAARTARLDTPGLGGWLRTYPCSHGPIRGLRGCRASPPFEAEPTGLLQQPTLSFLAENPSIRGKAYFFD